MVMIKLKNANINTDWQQSQMVNRIDDKEINHSKKVS